MKNELIKQIEALKSEKNAVILAHYYVADEVQAIADYVGDSFYLAKIAKQSEADVIVFCGVSFMGESAKILNPDKTVLMPDMTADCPMAHMVAEGKIAEMRAKYDDLAVVCYINSMADIKCQSDVCVTSSNAVKIVRSLPNKHIFFVPDRNLGAFVAGQVPEKQFILNDGCCPVHVAITPDTVREQKAKHLGALVLSHPECNPAILELSDYIGSTAEIISFVKNSAADEFIICTEDGVGYQLRLDNPDKKFYFGGSCPRCPDMKLNSLEKLLHVLKTGENAVEIDEEVRKKALVPLDRMLELAK